MVKLNFDKLGGLIPAVVQDHQTDEVLMLAFMDEAAWRHTLETGLASFHSRTRNSLWVKGKTSGHIQRVKEIWVDCDEDTVLLKVEQVGGAACHTGHRSCFHKKLTAKGFETVGRPVFNPEEVYKS